MIIKLPDIKEKRYIDCHGVIYISQILDTRNGIVYQKRLFINDRNIKTHELLAKTCSGTFIILGNLYGMVTGHDFVSESDLEKEIDRIFEQIKESPNV